MLQSDPEKRITAQRLQGEYVLSKEWSNVREGYAARKSYLHYPQPLRYPQCYHSFLTDVSVLSTQTTGSLTRVFFLGPQRVDFSIS